MDTNGLSLADIAAVTKDTDGEGFGSGGGAWLIIVLFIFLFGAGGNGWGNNGVTNAVTNAEMQDQFNFAALERQNNETVAAVRQGVYDVTGSVKDVAYTNLSNIRDIEAAVAQLGYAQSQCCCETNRNIDAVRYENAQNTCSIEQNATANTQKVLDRLCQMEQNAKDAQIASLQGQVNQYQTVQAILTTQGQYVTNPPCYNPCGCAV